MRKRILKKLDEDSKKHDARFIYLRKPLLRRNLSKGS